MTVTHATREGVGATLLGSAGMQPPCSHAGGVAVVVRAGESPAQGEGRQVLRPTLPLGDSYDYADGTVSDAGLRTPAEAGDKGDRQARTSVHQVVRLAHLRATDGMGL